MALPVSPTLAEIRQSVAIRLNMGVQASTSTAMHPVLDEYIRQAFNLLINEAEWAILEVVEEIALIDRQHFYDIPDNIAPGDIHQITVENVDKQEFPLDPGVEYYERNLYRIDRGDKVDQPGQLPLRWDIENGNLAIYPAPDVEQYPKLIVRGLATPREPYKDDDRAFIDKEAHITQAVIALKIHYKMDPAADIALMQRHERNIKAKESDGESVQIGPTRSRRYAEQNDRIPRNNRDRFWPDFDPFSDTYYT